MKITIIAILLVAISGCALFATKNSPFLQAGVDAAVAAAVQKGIPATKIKQLATQILADANGQQAALSTLDTFINSEVAKLKLPAGDAAGAAILATALEGFIQAGLSGTAASQVTAQTLVDVTILCNDLIAATALYGA